METALKRAAYLTSIKEWDDAMDLINQVLMIDPNHSKALIMATHILDKARRWPAAYQFAQRAVSVAPLDSSSWQNLGRLSEELYQLDDAERCYKKAMQLSRKPRVLAMNLNNLSSYYNTVGNSKEAERIALATLEIEPDNQKAHGNLGIAQLAQKKWQEGWVNYGFILGSEYRKIMKYRDEPEWDGTPGKTVVVYGEQGLGDEISFASMIPDALKLCSKLILDCDSRLETLFRRSFPQAKVYGTRWEKHAVWADEDQKPDYSISIGQLGKILRNKAEDFRGETYLVPPYERHIMWNEYFKTKRKPIIGIAWSGGLSWTAERFRRWKLEELQPLFDSVDAHWVSLQYKDASEEIRDFKGAQIHDYPFVTQNKNYDETAGLVSACDMVICMQTSVGHLAAALGIPTWVFVNNLSQWRYGGAEETIPWYKSMTVWRQDSSKRWPIDEAARVLKLRYSVPKLARA